MAEGGKAAKPTDDRYAEGQVWEYRTRPEDEGSLLKIQKIQALPAFGKGGLVYHVSVIGLNFCDLPLENSIEHMALSKASLDASVTRLSSSKADFPDVSDGMAEWSRGSGAAFTETVAEVVGFVTMIGISKTEISITPMAGTLETVVFFGKTTITSKLMINNISNVLEAVENGRRISVEMRSDRAYQIQNRMHTYSLITSEGWHRDFIPVVASDVLWLTLNHFSAGAWLTELLAKTVKTYGYAVLSVSIGYPTDGRVDGTAWGITIANEPVDVRDRIGGILFDQVDIAENTVIDGGAASGMLH